MQHEEEELGTSVQVVRKLVFESSWLLRGRDHTGFRE
jgi:hypothetical protein